MGACFIFWAHSLYVAHSSSAKGTHLNKVPQLLSDFLDQLRASDPLWLPLVVHDSDLNGSLIDQFT